MLFRRAQPHEIDDVISFYYDVIDHITATEEHPKWKRNVYPDNDYLRSSVESGELYIALDGDRIVGGLIMNTFATDVYSDAPWGIDASPEEVNILHTLAVHPSLLQRGIGRFMLEEAKRTARDCGIKALRLDILRGNTPAFRLYESAGFRYVSTAAMTYKSLGLAEFDLYELIL